jgi:trans-aconitate 2-methyltransferase
MWDPGQYRRFTGERARPFYELTERIGATDPRFVVDLGCGPGELTAELSRRWPAADVLGVDSSADMISAAREVLAGLTGSGSAAGPRLRFELGDVRDWQPERPPDIILASALLQWVPDHEPLLVRWVHQLSADGWLAFNIPGNFDQPAHVLLRELATSERWRPLLGDVLLNRQAADPADYLELLAGQGCVVDAWSTRYLQVLAGDDPVLEWYKGSALRPVIAALDPGQAAAFTADYAALLREAYPRRPYGTVLPFRRVFVVAHR